MQISQIIIDVSPNGDVCLPHTYSTQLVIIDDATYLRRTLDESCYVMSIHTYGDWVSQNMTDHFPEMEDAY